MKLDNKTLKQYRKNLRVWYNRASSAELISGATWYDEANEFCTYLSEKYGISTECAAGVVSALSPNNKWDRNKIDAENVVEAYKLGWSSDMVRVCTYNANKDKAFRILMEDGTGKELTLKSSPKTFSFAMNVGKLDPNYVTIDKWHLRAMQSISLSPKELSTSCTTSQYKVLERETLRVAEEMGVNGMQFQATVWVTIRNSWMNG